MIIEVIHNFFFFLNSNEGTLLKYSIELLLFLIITYMIISEFLRTKEIEMKFLAIGFSCLCIEKLIISSFMWYHVFGGMNMALSLSRLPLIDNCLEILALIWFSNAFIYPLFRNKRKRFYNKIQLELLATLLLIILVTIFWINILNNNQSPGNFYLFKGNLLFQAIKIFFLIMPVIFLIRTKKPIKHRGSIIIAFMVYMITPLIGLINLTFYNGGHSQLQGIIHPFPLLSVLLFTRVIYLKLANKLTLQQRLKTSEKKYLEAKEINKLKDKFVSIVSHELKTPLTTIKLYLSLMKSGEFGKVSQEQENALGILKSESDRLTNLVNDVLDLAKLEEKKISLDLSKVNISELLFDNSHYVLAMKNGIKIIKKMPDEFFAVVDQPKFQQIFINLLSNAIKHTPKDGKITVGVADMPKEWSLSIEDTGCGIPKDKISKLFTRFYQIDDPLTRKHGGTGLGLSIVKGLVELHQGKIKIDSEIDKGTNITIIFPKKIESENSKVS